MRDAQDESSNFSIFSPFDILSRWVDELDDGVQNPLVGIEMIL